MQAVQLGFPSIISPCLPEWKVELDKVLSVLQMESSVHRNVSLSQVRSVDVGISKNI